MEQVPPTLAAMAIARGPARYDRLEAELVLATLDGLRARIAATFLGVTSPTSPLRSAQ